MISAVVMPNHVHELFVQNPEWPLEKLIRSWRGFAARRVNALLNRSCGFGNAITSIASFVIKNTSQIVCAISGENPGKAQLTRDEFILWESELAKGIA